MRLAALPLLVAVLTAVPISVVDAGYCGAGAVFARRGCGKCGSQACKSTCDYECHTVMQTRTRTVYDTVCETQEKVVYDTVWEEQTVQDVHRVAETHYRQEEFTYQRPVYENVSREVPYTINRPVQEMRTREVSYMTYMPSYETRTRSVPYTCYKTVCETGTRTVSYCVPRKVCYTKTVPVYGGRWETRIEKCPDPVSQKSSAGDCAQKGVCEPRTICRRVWVPCVTQREVTCHKTVYDNRQIQVPYTIRRVVPEVHTRDVKYTVRRLVSVPQTRTVCYQVTKMVPEHHVRTVCSTVTRMVPETGCRTVPHTTWHEVPVTRTECVPRQVPRTVICNVSRRVPRTECYQVPVRVCSPVPKGGKGGKGGSFGDSPLDGSLPGGGVPVPLPPVVDEPELATPPEDTALRSEVPVAQASVQLASSPRAVDAGRSFRAGQDNFRNRQWEFAAECFKDALDAAPGNAKYAYLWAASLYQTGRADAAHEALDTAVELERQSPVAAWGRTMQRIQGKPRLWLEEGRKQLSATQ